MKLPITLSVRGPGDKRTKFPERVLVRFSSEYATSGVEYKLVRSHDDWRSHGKKGTKWHVYQRVS